MEVPRSCIGPLLHQRNPIPHSRVITNENWPDLVHREPPKSALRDWVEADGMVSGMDGFMWVCPVDDFPTVAQLRQRYHALALEMHPDRQGGNEARFKMLAKCYRHLSSR